MPHSLFDAPNYFFARERKNGPGTRGRADGGDLDIVEVVIPFVRFLDETGPRRAR